MCVQVTNLKINCLPLEASSQICRGSADNYTEAQQFSSALKLELCILIRLQITRIVSNEPGWDGCLLESRYKRYLKKGKGGAGCRDESSDVFVRDNCVVMLLKTSRYRFKIQNCKLQVKDNNVKKKIKLS